MVPFKPVECFLEQIQMSKSFSNKTLYGIYINTTLVCHVSNETTGYKREANRVMCLSKQSRNVSFSKVYKNE